MPNDGEQSTGTTGPVGAADSTRAPTAPAEFRYAAGPGVPEWAVGKTAAEVLGLAVQQNEIIAGMPGAPDRSKDPPNEKPWQQVSAQQAAHMGMPTVEDWVASPDQAFQRGAQRMYDTMIAPALEQVATGIAQSARHLALQGNPDLFKKYGPEIDNLVVHVPPSQRNIDLYRNAMDIVRSRHFDDEVDARVQAKLAAMPAGERSLGGASGGPGPKAGFFDWDKLPPTVRDKWQRAGITEETIREDCAKWGTTPDRLLEQTVNSQMVSETPDGGWTVTREALKVPGGFR